MREFRDTYPLNAPISKHFKPTPSLSKKEKKWQNFKFAPDKKEINKFETLAYHERDNAYEPCYDICVFLAINFLQHNIEAITACRRIPQIFTWWFQKQSEEMKSHFLKFEEKLISILEPSKNINEAKEYAHALWHPSNEELPLEELSLFAGDDSKIAAILAESPDLLEVILTDASEIQSYFDQWYLEHPEEAQERTSWKVSIGVSLPIASWLAKIFFGHLTTLDFIEQKTNGISVLHQLNETSLDYLCQVLKISETLLSLDLSQQTIKNFSPLQEMLIINKTLTTVILPAISSSEIIDLFHGHHASHPARTLIIKEYNQIPEHPETQKIAFKLACQQVRGAKLSLILFDDPQKQAKFEQFVKYYQTQAIVVLLSIDKTSSGYFTLNEYQWNIKHISALITIHKQSYPARVFDISNHFNLKKEDYHQIAEELAKKQLAGVRLSLKLFANPEHQNIFLKLVKQKKDIIEGNKENQDPGLATQMRLTN